MPKTQRSKRSRRYEKGLGSTAGHLSHVHIEQAIRLHGDKLKHREFSMWLRSKQTRRLPTNRKA